MIKKLRVKDIPDIFAMQGSVAACDLHSNNPDYSYRDTLNELQSIYGFSVLGEGGFGVVLGNNQCAIKVIKNIKRCSELEKEKIIYQIIQSEKDKYHKLVAQVPKFNIYKQLNTYCQFNSERISSPLSGWGDPYEDDYGNGYVIGIDKSTNNYIFRDLHKSRDDYIIDRSLVYPIDKPGNLIHFYINDPDPDLKYVLENYQGKLYGQNTLEYTFGVDLVRKFAYWIGQLLSFIIFKCGILPFDVEVVIGAKSQTDRELIPFIYDFNECFLINDLPRNISQNVLVSTIAKSLYSKNGRNYFPNSKNKYYDNFVSGFTEDPESRDLAIYVLKEYNLLFNIYS